MKIVYPETFGSSGFFMKHHQKAHSLEEQKFFTKTCRNPLTNISECDIIFITESDITKTDRSESDKGGTI